MQLGGENQIRDEAVQDLELAMLIAVALIANATWQLFIAYSAHFKFTDSVENVSQFGADRSEAELRSRVMELAGEYDVPLTEQSFTLERDERHTVVAGSYTRPVGLFPGFSYNWPFRWHVETLSVRAATPR